MRLRTSVAVATAFAAIFTGCGGASSSDQVNGAPAEDATTEEDQEFCDALRGADPPGTPRTRPLKMPRTP